MIIRISLGIVILGFLFLFAGASFAQDRPPRETGCNLIDKNHPPQFILYEGKSDPSVINLRLRNNSNCPIVVETDDALATQLKKLPNGGMKIEPVIGSHDGVRLRLHYLIEHRLRGEAPKPAYGWGDSVFTYHILAGQSVIFAIPATDLKRHFDIAVPFNYSWEGRTSVMMAAGGVVHRVYFLFDDLSLDQRP